MKGFYTHHNKEKTGTRSLKQREMSRGVKTGMCSVSTAEETIFVIKMNGNTKERKNLSSKWLFIKEDMQETS